MRWTITIWAVSLAALAGLAVAAYDALKRPGDVSNRGVEFKEREDRPGKPKEKVETVDWPVYGYDIARTKNLDVNVGPPLRKIWSWDSKELIEFSPVVVNDRIYGMNNDSLFFALDADTGKVLWKRHPGELNASSPVYHKGILYAVNMEPAHVFALRARDGKVVWSKPLPGRSESSPVIYKGKLIFGCECASVLAYDAKTGKQVWATSTEGEVKAAPAVADGKVYVGDYAGEMYAFNAVNGDMVWQASGQGGAFGQSGRFYSAPAVAYGRVYASNVDGRVYSFSSEDGALAWSQSTGDWVYSAAVAGETANGRPAVFAASFDHNAYAFDARTGDVIWSNDVGGIVSGAGGIIGDVYYVSILAGKTIGLDTDSGEKVFEFPKGEYNPVISDGERIYLTGYSSINALEPKEEKRKKGGGGKRGKGGGPEGGEGGKGKGSKGDGGSKGGNGGKGKGSKRK
jgi:outer membrane protein assembly factor BamB